MERRDERPPVLTEEQTDAIDWLRRSMAGIFEVSPLEEDNKKRALKFLSRLPDRTMATWADTLNIDYMWGFRTYPDFPQSIRCEEARYFTDQYLNDRNVIPTHYNLNELVHTMKKLSLANRLPVDKEIVERGVCALALSQCTQDGVEFSRYATNILGGNSQRDIVSEYQHALENAEVHKLTEFDAALRATRYGGWVGQRLTETKRFLGLEPPRFTIRVGERTPQWDLLWKKVFTGGDE